MVPQHEGFGNALDGIAQAHVGDPAARLDALLLADVDGDAEQVGHAAAAALVDDVGARAQPDPGAVCAAQPEGVVDQLAPAAGQVLRQPTQGDVVRVRQHFQFRRAQHGLARRHAQQRAHGIGKHEAAFPQVPLPQPAAPARQRRRQADALGVAQLVDLAQPVRLPVERHADKQHQQVHRQQDRGAEAGFAVPLAANVGARDGGDQVALALRQPARDGHVFLAGFIAQVHETGEASLGVAARARRAAVRRHACHWRREGTARSPAPCRTRWSRACARASG